MSESLNANNCKDSCIVGKAGSDNLQFESSPNYV